MAPVPPYRGCPAAGAGSRRSSTSGRLSPKATVSSRSRCAYFRRASSCPYRAASLQNSPATMPSANAGPAPVAHLRFHPAMWLSLRMRKVIQMSDHVRGVHFRVRRAILVLAVVLAAGAAGAAGAGYVGQQLQPPRRPPLEPNWQATVSVLAPDARFSEPFGIVAAPY